VPCANGTDALQIAMMALDLKPGDEVIAPSFTYIATTEVIALLRLQPVFVDVDLNTMGLSPKSLEIFLMENAEMQNAMLNTFYSDYHEVNGLKIPYKSISKTDDGQTILTITLNKMEINITLPDIEFQ